MVIKRLTREYVESHMLTIHDYETWGKALAEQVLRQVKEQAGDGEAWITMELPVRVSATTEGCISICICGVSVHVRG